MNTSTIRQVSLECAGSRVPMSLISLLPDKEVLVGAVNVASDTVETPEEVANTLREATKFADSGRIIACTNCGLAPLPRALAEAKLVSLGRGANLLRNELG